MSLVVRIRPRFRPSRLAVAILLLSGLFVQGARGFTPKSPEVVAILKKATDFLQTEKATSGHPGGKCVIAYALLKAGFQPDHPKIREAVDATNAITLEEYQIYDACASLILLCELDSQEHSAMIQKLLDHVVKRQAQSGCWGYAQTPNAGDTSQQQYAILALWTADYNGFQVDTDVIERALNWLMRVQNPQGFYAYNPSDPGNFNRMEQPASFRPSLQAAGAGSMYICGDMLRLNPGSLQDDDLLPPALKVVKEESNRPGAPRVVDDVNEDAYEERVGTANAAFSTYGIESHYQYYYLYTLERYMSFREIAHARKEAEPAWYDEGVRFLQGAQQADGSVKLDQQSIGTGVEAAFSVLFLVRSTAKSIERKIQREGLLLGGMGLPSDTTNVRISGGRVVGMELSKNLDDLIELLENEDEQENVEVLAGQIEALEIVPGARLSDEQTTRLNRLAAHSSYEIRILAVNAMMRSRDVRTAPALIYALSDPDDRVKVAARDALRFISRRFEGFPMPDAPNELEVEKAQEQARVWYRTVAPPGAPLP